MGLGKASLLALLIVCAGCASGSPEEASLVLPVGVAFAGVDEDWQFFGGMGASWGVPSGAGRDRTGARTLDGMTVAELTAGTNDEGQAFLTGRLYHESRSRRVSMPVGILLTDIRDDTGHTWDFLISLGVALHSSPFEHPRYRVELSGLVGAQGIYGLLPQWSVTWLF